MEVIRLLETKNRCLRKLLKFSMEFRALAEKGDFTSLPQLELKRDAVFRALDLFDRKITEVASSVPPEMKTDAFFQMLQMQIEQNSQITQAVLDNDRLIATLLEKEQDRLQQEIRSSKKGTDLMKKFKSQWIPESGEGLDEKL